MCKIRRLKRPNPSRFQITCTVLLRDSLSDSKWNLTPWLQNCLYALHEKAVLWLLSCPEWWRYKYHVLRQTSKHFGKSDKFSSMLPENNDWIFTDISDTVLDTGDPTERKKDKSLPLWIIQSSVTLLWRKYDGEKYSRKETQAILEWGSATVNREVSTCKTF